MKKCVFLCLLFFSSYLFSQVYDVSIYEKIGYTIGGFDDSLEDEDWFGYSIENIGDLNGDGVSDIAVGSLKDDDGGFNRGAVYIMFLNLDGSINSYQKISNTEGNFYGDLDDWDIFGTSLSYLGDMNGDGFIELGVGAEYDGDGGYNHGAIYILSLDNDGTVMSYVKISDTEGNFDAELNDWDVFGTDIESIGDFNGDGFTDIAVGARRDGDGGSGKGAVYFLYLNSDFTVDSYSKISDTEGGFEGYLNSQDYFGGSIANIGDLNGDGVIDLAIGAYRDDDGGLNRGCIYILFMFDDGMVDSVQKISDTAGGFEEDFNDEMFFGISVDKLIDINDDGLEEIVVGAKGYENEGEENFGAFYILNLNPDGTVDNYVKYTEGLQYFDGDITEGDSFGFSVAYLDLLIDKNNIGIGAFFDDEGGTEMGSVWILQLGAVLSIEDLNKENKIFIFPNPSKTSFSLSNPSGIEKIQVFDAYGKKVVSFSNIENNLFNVAYLPIGNYIIALTDETGEIFSYKLIKQ